MSLTAVHASKDAQRSCERCRGRKARFQHRGHVKADRDHTLCFECYRAERERRRARQLSEAAGGAQTAPALAPAPRPLTGRALEHRRRMLAYLHSVGAPCVKP